MTLANALSRIHMNRKPAHGVFSAGAPLRAQAVTTTLPRSGGVLCFELNSPMREPVRQGAELSEPETSAESTPGKGGD